MMTHPEIEKPKRSIFLTIVLILILIQNTNIAVRLVLHVLASSSYLSTNLLYFAAFPIINSIFVFFIWRLKKMGVYGFIITGLIAFFPNCLFNFFYAVAGLILIIIMVITILPSWNFFK